jgi:hypothetical protein
LSFTPSVTQITAGTNVTISPSGGTGNVTVNAGGGLPAACSNPGGGVDILCTNAIKAGSFQAGSGNTVTIGALGSATNWNFDTTSAATARASLGGASTVPQPIAAPAYYSGGATAVNTWTTNAQTDAVGDYVLLSNEGYAGTPPASLTVTSSPSETWSAPVCTTGGLNIVCWSSATIGTAGSHTFTITADGGKTTTYPNTTVVGFTGTTGVVNASAVMAPSNISNGPIARIFQSTAISTSQRTLNILCTVNVIGSGTPYVGPFYPGSFGTLDNTSNGITSPAGNYGMCEHYITAGAVTGLLGQAWLSATGNNAAGIGSIVAVNY